MESGLAVFVVFQTAAVPNATTGFLSRYLSELESGLFVGTLSRRLADRLWESIGNACGSGHAIGIFSGGSEAGYTIRVHNHPVLEVVDFDGLPGVLISRQTR